MTGKLSMGLEALLYRAGVPDILTKLIERNYIFFGRFEYPRQESKAKRWDPFLSAP